ncbi:hypothetical protein Thiowin_01788 [Thiorhodovibrio winogradskyi]|uniref:Uncharacterized protein n=2 Tax=Thiorhodovibrio winogradskyi TaxID=77007 RepID=A0ABZ0S945_9GAMM
MPCRRYDITLSADFATLRGFTQQDLETRFAAYLAGVDRDAPRALTARNIAPHPARVCSSWGSFSATGRAT